MDHYKEEKILNIIKDAMKGSIFALEELLKREEKDIYLTLKYLDAGNSDIADLTQEVLLKVSKNITKLKNANNFKVWVNRITVRHFYDYLRRKKRYNERINASCEISIFDEDDNKIIEIPDYSTNPVKCVLEGELDSVIKLSIKKLPEPYRATIIMRELQGLSYDEIAKVMRSSVGTVKSRIARARCKLKEYIMPYIC